MKTVKKILTALEGYQIFSTTRGTTGDAAGMLLVDEDCIDLFKNADVCSLPELKNINAIAYEDCVDYIDGDPVLSSWDKDDFLVIYQDCIYLLVWEQD
jgi:hypothetical protein